MSQELLVQLEAIEKEKGITKEILLDALKQALLSACHKTYPDKPGIDVEIDPLTFRIRLVNEGVEVRDTHFGRIAAQTAKQVIIQKMR